MLNYFAISDTEITASTNAGLLSMADMSLKGALRALYSAKKSFCEDLNALESRKICLYLYLYAIDSWCNDDCCNVLSEAEFVTILGRIEELTIL